MVTQAPVQWYLDTDEGLQPIYISIYLREPVMMQGAYPMCERPSAASAGKASGCCCVWLPAASIPTSKGRRISRLAESRSQDRRKRSREESPGPLPPSPVPLLAATMRLNGDGVSGFVSQERGGE